MNKIAFGFFIVVLLQCGFLTEAQQQFVQTKGHRLMLGNQPYYYIGANYWYGSYLGLMKDHRRGIDRLRAELDFLHANGVNNLRVLAGAEGKGLINGVQRVGPPLQPERGKFDEAVLHGLDVLLYEMGRRNMKAVLYLSNNWEWSGGFQQYLIWNHLVPDAMATRKLSWKEQGGIVSRFYTCAACKEDYLKQVNVLLNRTNTVSHKKYTDDPAIMAWELANEPRPMEPSASDAYRQWISEVAAAIKAKDRHHLITTGHEGSMGADLQTFEAIHADRNIDYLTIHIWPKNWGWFRDTAIGKDMQNVTGKTMQYIQTHEAIAGKLNKPMVLEEFGLPRNNQLFDTGASTALRDAYYRQVFTVWQQSKNSGGPIAGASFWAFGGMARPVNKQVFWKEGDDYMGDPPMEEQGLNTVFDCDTSTWNVITSFTKSSTAHAPSNR